MSLFITHHPFPQTKKLNLLEVVNGSQIISNVTVSQPQLIECLSQANLVTVPTFQKQETA